MEKEKLTICFLGSAESIHTLKWAKYFSDKGHKVHLISYIGPVAKRDIGGINLYFIRKTFPIEIWPFNTLLNLPITLLKVSRLIKKINPDIINSHYITSYGSLAVLLNFHPLIITAWGSDILVAPEKFLPSKWSIKYALSKADLITCDAEHMKEAMIKLGAPESKIKIINFGIDTEKFNPFPRDEKLKEELSMFGKKVVISLRSLEKLSDIESLIRGIPFILKEFPEVIFIIIGKGSQEEELKKLSDDLGIGDNIKFLGQIPNDDLPKYLRIADVYISTSLSDAGLSASTAEAMACELPVVITDVADNKNWVENGKNGFIIPVKNPGLLAQRIIFLLKNENIRKEFGKKNRKIIKERNDYFKEMAKMEEIYKNLIKNPPKIKNKL